MYLKALLYYENHKGPRSPTKLLTSNKEEFPESNDATVDFPTPLPPTIETKDNCVL